MRRAASWLWGKVCAWLMQEDPPSDTPLCDFGRLRYELRPGDIVLVEGRSRISEVIKLITQSAWTHSALYVGRLYDIEDAELRQRVCEHYRGDPKEPLLIEALLGEGTIAVPVSKYRRDHLRICRPSGLSPADARKVIEYAIRRLGLGYDVRQLLDLARFFFPWGVLPRRWRSSLFQHNAGTPTRTVCSCILAEAFSSVDFPILPFIDRRDDGDVRFFKRNPRLFTPKDFDYSPYFDIIKYPFLGLDDLAVYRKLPWADEHLIYNDDEAPVDPEIELPPLKNPDIGLQQPIVERETRAPSGTLVALGDAEAPEATPPVRSRGPLLRILRKRSPGFPFLKRGY